MFVLKNIYYGHNWQFRYKLWENSSQVTFNSPPQELKIQGRNQKSHFTAQIYLSCGCGCSLSREGRRRSSLCIYLPLSRSIQDTLSESWTRPRTRRAVNSQVYRLASVWETHSDGIIHPARRKDKMVITSFSLFNIFLYRGKWLLLCEQINFSWSVSESIWFVDC